MKNVILASASLVAVVTATSAFADYTAAVANPWLNCTTSPTDGFGGTGYLCGEMGQGGRFEGTDKFGTTELNRTGKSGQPRHPRWNGEYRKHVEPTCEFYDIIDGTMVYSPSRLAENGASPRGGVWVADVPAYISIRYLGASQVMVESLNVVRNSSDSNAEYRVQVDYSPYPNNVSTMAGETIDLLTDGVPGRTHVLPESGDTWNDGGATTPHFSRYGAVLDRQAGGEWTPFFASGSNGYGDGMSSAAEDRVVWNLPDNGAERNAHLAIDGVAWMVDQSNGNLATSYDTQYGMTKGDYYAPHKVTCLQ